MLSKHFLETKVEIKWPNDIYINDKKYVDFNRNGSKC